MAAARASAVTARGMATAAAAGPARNLLFLGAPGVGKGTFAGRVAKRLGIPAISTGDIIRGEIKAGSALGARVKEFTNAGKLVPDEIVTAMVKERLKQADAQAGYILDGYPRTTQQAKDLDAFQVRTRVGGVGGGVEGWRWRGDVREWAPGPAYHLCCLSTLTCPSVDPRTSQPAAVRVPRGKHRAA